jgi:large subunit ribosomal protein L30
VKKDSPKEQKKCLIAVRLRGQSGIRQDIEATLSSLRLMKKHHASFYYDEPQTSGMLKKAKDYLTWGEAKPDTIRYLLEKKSEVRKGKRLTVEFAKGLGYTSIEDLAQAISKGDLPLDKFWKSGVKPVFRLHPPIGGFKGTIRHSYESGGELGYRGDSINHLVSRMA